MRYGFAYGGVAAALMAFAAATTPGGSAKADASEEAIVARVGKETITAGDLRRRIAAIPPFQLRSFGKSEEEIKRNFLEKVLVRDLLLAQGALDQKLDQEPDTMDRARATLRSAMVQQVRMDTLAAPVTDAEVEAYYKDNAEKFHSPERVAIWRILVPTREEAVKIVEEMKKDLSVKRWSDLARERSVDKATNMRGGNLGYVEPDGKTTDPSITVDRALLDAVRNLKDGEPAAEPVKEGEKWAVVWRRQTMKAVERPLETEAAGIRQTIARQRTEDRLKAVIEHATEDRVKDVTADLVEDITVSAQGDLQPARRPGVLPSRKSAPGLPLPHNHR